MPEYNESKLTNDVYRVVIDVFERGDLFSSSHGSLSRAKDWINKLSDNIQRLVVRIEHGTVSNWEAIE